MIFEKKCMSKVKSCGLHGQNDQLLQREKQKLERKFQIHFSNSIFFNFHFYFLDKYGVSGRPYQSS